MEKRKCLTFLFCLILCYSLFQHTARAQSSSQASIFSQGSITYSPSNVNLAVIPNDWGLTYGSGTQIIYLDYNVTLNGDVSIRLEPHTDNDVNYARECDGTWYTVSPGDHIVAGCWIKTGPTQFDPTQYPGALPQFQGARIGIDLYAPSGAGNIVIVASKPDTMENHIAGEVSWGTTTWTLRTWDIIVPSTIFTQDINGNAILPTPVTQIVMWLQGTPVTFQDNAWFADAYLYINPT